MHGIRVCSLTSAQGYTKPGACGLISREAVQGPRAERIGADRATPDEPIESRLYRNFVTVYPAGCDAQGIVHCVLVLDQEKDDPLAERELSESLCDIG